METLSGFDEVSIDRVQFVDLYPENFKCDQCGLLVRIIIKTTAPFKLTENGFEDSSLNAPSRPKCGHKFCRPCYNSLSFDGRFLKCPIDSLIVPKKENNCTAEYYI
uniref:Uncharacterized protein n=1 Tax=Tetranychus urticae TaxID=32264 RepID=T1KZB6_TETUR